VFIFSKAVVEDEEGSDEEDAADPTVTEAIVRYYNIGMPVNILYISISRSLSKLQ
jgi:hypothetical protein